MFDMTAGKGTTARASLAVGIALAVILCRLTPCWGMDVMSEKELNNLQGQAGLTLSYCGTMTITQSFRSLNQGDPDGWGMGYSANPGWLVLYGNGSNSGYIRIVIADGARWNFDVGRTGASVCYPISSVTHPGFQIPANTPFFVFGLTNTSISLQDPTTVNIYFSNAAHTAPAGDRVGYIKESGVAIDKRSMPSELYLWAHP